LKDFRRGGTSAGNEAVVVGNLDAEEPGLIGLRDPLAADIVQKMLPEEEDDTRPSDPFMFLQDPILRLRNFQLQRQRKSSLNIWSSSYMDRRESHVAAGMVRPLIVYVFNFKETAQSKQLPIGQKFAPSGHPDSSLV
jgi:hypothetical protein